MTSPTQYSLLIQGHNPAPQGSKAYAGHRRDPRTGRSLPYLREESARVRPWRGVVTTMAVAARARQKLTAPLDGPLQAHLVFIMEPSGKALAALAKDTLSVFPTTRRYGDVDKLQRSTLDALCDAHVLADDSLIVDVHAIKVFPGQLPKLNQPGAYIRLRRLDPASLTL